MQIIRDDTEFKIDKETAVSIGKFDGVHIGHKRLIRDIVNQKKNGLLSVVFTFDPSSTFFRGDGILRQIIPTEEKRRIFEEMGVDILVEYPLNEDTAHIPPEDFLGRVLSDSLNMRYISCGKDVSFGYKGTGNLDLLYEQADRYSYSVSVVDDVYVGDLKVSSTLLRSALSAGNTHLATEILGRPYLISGTVEHGRRLGRTMGMPTMNIYPDDSLFLPKTGVYYTYTLFDNSRYPGITNVGVRPTVSNEQAVSVETYLYDFDTDMYGKDISVEFLKYRREEQRFDSLNDLRKMMESDILAGREFFGKDIGK